MALDPLNDKILVNANASPAHIWNLATLYGLVKSVFKDSSGDVSFDDVTGKIDITATSTATAVLGMAIKLSNQTIPKNVPTAITTAIATTVSASTFSTSTFASGVFTVGAGEAGWYGVSFSATAQGANIPYRILAFIDRDGTDFAYGGDTGSAFTNVDRSAHCSGYAYCAEGETINFSVFVDSTGATPLILSNTISILKH